MVFVKRNRKYSIPYAQQEKNDQPFYFNSLQQTETKKKKTVPDGITMLLFLGDKKDSC